MPVSSDQVPLTQVSDSLLIIIPMAGLGTRFSEAGFQTVKPMIPVLDSPMIAWLLHNLKLTNPTDQVWVALQHSVAKDSGLDTFLTSQFPQVTFKFVLLDGPTRGAADTVQKVVDKLPDHALSRRVITLDCDTFYFSDILSTVRMLPNDVGGSGYFYDEGNAPLFSYLSFADDKKTICHVAEKVAISRNANTGAYSFASANLLKEHLNILLAVDLPKSGEFYISDLIKLMMKSGCRFEGFFVDDFSCVGTPGQLKHAVSLLKKRKDLHKFIPDAKEM